MTGLETAPFRVCVDFSRFHPLVSTVLETKARTGLGLGRRKPLPKENLSLETLQPLGIPPELPDRRVAVFRYRLARYSIAAIPCNSKLRFSTEQEGFMRLLGSSPSLSVCWDFVPPTF